MHRIAISDESHTHNPGKCYGIGAFVMPADRYADMDLMVRRIFETHGIVDEMKWSVTPTAPRIAAACEAIEALLKSDARFYVIVVEKSTFANRRRLGNEDAFYQTYQFLADHIAKSGDGTPFVLWMDERSDSYDKYPEVVQKITNYQSAKRADTAQLLEIKMIDSKQNMILQLVDLLTGAIVADTHKYLSDETLLNHGKEELIRRFAAYIGWDRLCHDTLPNPYFNIWHFPMEFRDRPRTRRIVRAWLKPAA